MVPRGRFWTLALPQLEPCRAAIGAKRATEVPNRTANRARSFARTSIVKSTKSCASTAGSCSCRAPSTSIAGACITVIVSFPSHRSLGANSSGFVGHPSVVMTMVSVKSRMCGHNIAEQTR